MYEAGYGSPSRVYEGTPTGRGMTPAVYRRRGSGVEIGYAIVRSATGPAAGGRQPRPASAR